MGNSQSEKSTDSIRKCVSAPSTPSITKKRSISVCSCGSRKKSAAASNAARQPKGDLEAAICDDSEPDNLLEYECYESRTNRSRCIPCDNIDLKEHLRTVRNLLFPSRTMRSSFLPWRGNHLA